MTLEILNLTTLDKLRGLEALLADKRRWTQRAYARDRNSREVYPSTNKRACRWCLYGAAELFGSTEITAIALSASSVELFGRGFVDLNDTRGHAAVMRVIRRAIEIEEGRE